MSSAEEKKKVAKATRVVGDMIRITEKNTKAAFEGKRPNAGKEQAALKALVSEVLGREPNEAELIQISREIWR